MIIFSNSTNRLVIHLLFWMTMFYLRFITLQYSLSAERVYPTGLPNFLMNIGLFYFIISLQNSPKKVSGSYLLGCSIMAYILYKFGIFLYLKFVYLQIENHQSPTLIATIKLVDDGIIPILLGKHSSFYYIHDIGFELFFPLLIKIGRDYYETKIRLLQSEQEQTKLELEQLRNQFNPHFLFNNLNSIYSLSLQNQTDTSEAILKLSNLLRSTLYDTKKDWVSFSAEWQLICDYVDLAKWRHGKKILVLMESEEGLNDIYIPSFVFLNLIENAFKHGVEHHTGDPKAWVKIEFRKNQQNLVAEISNSYSPNDNLTSVGGIGLINTKRRLELLLGPNFELKTSIENGIFKVKVVIPFTHN